MELGSPTQDILVHNLQGYVLELSFFDSPNSPLTNYYRVPWASLVAQW